MTEASAVPVTNVDAAVREATLMEDRAQVVRRGAVSLAPGRHQLVVTGLSPVVADRTVRCRLRGAEGVTVHDVRVRREYVTRTGRPEREQELRAAIDEAVGEYLVAHDRLATLLAERKLLAAAAAATSRSAADRLLAGAFDAATAEEIDRLFQRRAEIEEQALAEGFGQDDRLERIERLRREQAAALATLVSECRTSAIVSIEARAAGQWELELEYLVPCALWRPEYAAEIVGEDEPLVRWSTGGTVWQATGEDWTGVALSCSTARPTLGAELPLLQDDVLVSRAKSEEERKTIAVTSRDQEIATTGSVAQPRESDTPPGVDDGGEVRIFRVPEAVDVPSDGRPHRFSFESWEAAAERELVAAPARAAWVFMRSVQTNPSAMPLLAGPVTLVRNGVFVGRSEVAYVAPGERFDLSWGSEDGLVVLRDESRSVEETLVRKQRRHAFEVKIYLANHTGAPAKLRLVERVPVSELSQIDVEIDEDGTTRGFQKDPQGIVSWKIDLPPRGEATVALAFQVAMPANVRWDG